MNLSANWEAARQLRVKEKLSLSENIFSGGSKTETSSVDAVPIVRLSVWPSGQESAPSSFAVTASQRSEEVVGVEVTPHTDEAWPDDLDDDYQGPERRGPTPAPEQSDDFAEFNDSLEAKGWQTSSETSLPLGLKWVQAAESRWELSFDLPSGAQCLGLGERLSGLNLRSKSHTLFTTDSHIHIPSTDAMYKSIPFLIVQLQGACYGIFLDSPARQRWHLDDDMSGTAHVELLSRRGWQLYVIGPAPLPKLISVFTTLTGRHRLPPQWSLGHHQSRWSYPDQDTVVTIAHQYRSRNIPCDAIVLDIDYMDGYRVFTYSKERFPDLPALISDLKQNNFNVITITDPGVKREAKYYVYADGKKHSYFCTRNDGKPFLGEVWAGTSAFPDFLRDDVRMWWAAQQGFHTDLGVAGIWNDMNEPAIFHNQEPLPWDARELPADDQQLFLQTTKEGKVGHYEVRCVYGQQMSRASYDGLLALRPKERPFVLSRAAYAGIQKYAAVWLGDNKSWWEHLRMSMPMLMNMGLSGVAFCGVDVGGFGEDCTAELLVRWYAVGLFYPYFRNHSAMGTISQEPWAFGEETERLCKKFIDFRYKLLPHINSLFWEHLRTGAPLMRPLSWHYPQDEYAQQVDDQFMFGESILVAPIVERAKSSRAVYLPEGFWYPIEGGDPLEGGRLHQIRYDLDTVPAFVKDGSVIAMADVVQSTDELANAAITFVAYGDRCRGVFFEDDGRSLDYENGSYNEWRLKVDEGVFVAQPVELGYDGNSRSYRLDWQGQRSDIALRL